MPARESLLTPEIASFVSGGVSITAASRDRHNLPASCRVLACRADTGEGLVTLLFHQQQASRLIRFAVECQRIAVVFSEPASHRTLQIKGDTVKVETADESDFQVLVEYRRLFADAVAFSGRAPGFVDALLDCPRRELTLVSFRPREVFEQTPGPAAGQRLGAA